MTIATIKHLELKELSFLKTKYQFKNVQYNQKFKIRKFVYSWKKL